MTFNAHGESRRISCASHTEPIPPPVSSLSIWNRSATTVPASHEDGGRLGASQLACGTVLDALRTVTGDLYMMIASLLLLETTRLNCTTPTPPRVSQLHCPCHPSRHR